MRRNGAQMMGGKGIPESRTRSNMTEQPLSVQQWLEEKLGARTVRILAFVIGVLPYPIIALGLLMRDHAAQH